MGMNNASSESSSYASNIILPPGSAGADLQAAIDSAATGERIIISGDMLFDGTVIIPDNQQIIICSDEGNHWTLTQQQTVPAMAFFDVMGSLTLEDITLNGEDYSPGTVIYGGTLTLGVDSVITNCRRLNGAGVYGYDHSTLILDGGTITANLATGAGGGVFMTGNSQMFMNSGDIRGNNTIEDYGGGVVITKHSRFDMSYGGIEQNSARTVGGGLFISGDSVLHMLGGYVSGNVAIVAGAGIFFEGGVDDASSVNELNSSSISYNNGGYYGCGMYVGAKANVVVTDTNFRNNHVEIRGGGCYIAKGAKVTMTHCEIDRNLTQYRGGGIYVEESDVAAALTLLGGTSVTYNYSHEGSGGIYTERNYDYLNILTDDTTSFMGNTADIATEPPADAYNRFPNIRYSSVSVFDSPINNYDINPIGDGPVVADVVYHANGGTGSYADLLIPIGTEYTILSDAQTGISNSGYTFDGWNTQADGTGTMYQPKDKITITEDMELYAIWTLVPEETVTVVYHSNGGIGSYQDTDIPRDFLYTFLSLNQTGISNSGYAFDGWNTQADGTGTMYQPGDKITITEDVILYAIWSTPSKPDCCIFRCICCKPYCNDYERCRNGCRKLNCCYYGYPRNRW